MAALVVWSVPVGFVIDEEMSLFDCETVQFGMAHSKSAVVSTNDEIDFLHVQKTCGGPILRSTRHIDTLRNFRWVLRLP
jgi:hypothetical protein